MIYVDPKQTSSDYNRQYEKDLSSPLKYYSKIEAYDKISFSERLRYLKKYFPKPGTLLEIGSSSGTFLKTAQKSNWQVVGIEPNISKCKEFRSHNKDVKIHNEFFNLDFAKKHKRKYDLIYSSDVIEHIQNPTLFLKACKFLLNKNGYLVTVTPDFDNILTKIFQIKPTEHLFYFNKKNIEFLYKKSSLKIIEKKNIHRRRNISAMLYSTTFTDPKNQRGLMPFVKLINTLRLNIFIEKLIDLFKEDLLIVAKV